MRWRTRQWTDWHHCFALLPVNTGEVTIWLEHYAWRHPEMYSDRIEYAAYGIDKLDLIPVTPKR